jgi:competence protein ComEC
VLALAYGAGIFIERYYPISYTVLCGAAACTLTVVLACICLRRTSAGTAAVVLLAAVLGGLAYAPFNDFPASVKQLEPWLHRPVAVEAEVRRVEPLASGDLRLTLAYDSIETAEEQLVCSGLVQATLHKASREYRYGQRLRLGCRLRRPRNFNNPGGFDYERFLAHRSIYFTAFLGDDRGIIVLQENGGHACLRALERYRSKLRGLVCERLDAPERDLVLALLLGEKQTLDPQIKEEFARLGVAHLRAISGLHIGILYGLAFALACGMLRRFPRLFLYVVLWKAAAVLALVPVAVYCCIAGLQIPTLRSGIMIAACIACLLINRRHDVLSALGLACAVILVWMPCSLFEISFQLSFGAVLFLILYAAPAQQLIAAAEGPADARHIRRGALWLYRFMAGTLAASMIASAATAPLTALYFQQLSLAGILSNCMLIPSIGFGAVPCALAAAVLLPLSETAAAAFLHTAALILEQSLVWIHCWSEIPLICARVAPPSPAAMTACYAALTLVPLCLRTRRIARAGLLCCAAAVLWLWPQAGRQDGCLRVTFLDVGHGDAAVIEFPQGRAMLIDSGGLRSDRFDTGESIVVPALRAMGIRDLDWLVLTHPHHDHMAGMPAVMEAFEPAELWVPADDYQDPGFRTILKDARRRGIAVRRPHAAAHALTIDGAVVECLSPDAQQAASARSYQDLNDGSLVIKISYGEHAFLFAGDIGARQENALLERACDLRARVLKVPHHGKRGSSTPAFLDAVNPASAVFSCRPYAGRDLPADVLGRYRERAIRQLRTDLHGAIQITSDGEQLTEYTFLPQRTFAPCGALPQPLRGAQAASH